MQEYCLPGFQANPTTVNTRDVFSKVGNEASEFLEYLMNKK